MEKALASRVVCVCVLFATLHAQASPDPQQRMFDLLQQQQQQRQQQQLDEMQLPGRAERADRVMQGGGGACFPVDRIRLRALAGGPRNTGCQQFAALVGYDTASASDFLTGLSENHETIGHTDGAYSLPFAVTPEHFLNPLVNADHLREIEDGYYAELLGLERRPILNALGMNTNFSSYNAALSYSRDEAARATNDQFLGMAVMVALGPVLGTRAAPMVLSPGLGLTTVGYARNGVDGAFNAAFGYMQVLEASGWCLGMFASCWVATPVMMSGFNDISKGVVYSRDETAASEVLGSLFQEIGHYNDNKAAAENVEFAVDYFTGHKAVFKGLLRGDMLSRATNIMEGAYSIDGAFGDLAERKERKDAE